MESTCKVGATFFSKNEAESCARNLEKVAGESHFISRAVPLPKAPNEWYVEKFEAGVCKEGAQFTNDDAPRYRDNKYLAKECAASLTRLTGIDHVAVLLKETGWFSADHYFVKKK